MPTDPAGTDAFAASLDPVERAVDDARTPEREPSSPTETAQQSTAGDQMDSGQQLSTGECPMDSGQQLSTAGDQMNSGQQASAADSQIDDAQTDQTKDDTRAHEERLSELERRVTAIEAELESVRGMLDGVNAIDEAVERRASVALAKVETLERAFDDGRKGDPRSATAATQRDGSAPSEQTRRTEREDTRPPDSGGRKPAPDTDEEHAAGADRGRGVSAGGYPRVRDCSSHSSGASVGGGSDSQLQEDSESDSLASRLRSAFQ
jgi:hypothetical protein